MDPIRPYLRLIGAIAALLMIAGVWFHGRVAGVRSMEAKVARKDAAIEQAATALRGSAAALREVNAEAERKIAEAKVEARNAGNAALALADMIERQEREQASREREWAEAKKRHGCAALLSSDIIKTCGVAPR